MAVSAHSTFQGPALEAKALLHILMGKGSAPSDVKPRLEKPNSESVGIPAFIIPLRNQGEQLVEQFIICFAGAGFQSSQTLSRSSVNLDGSKAHSLL